MKASNYLVTLGITGLMLVTAGCASNQGKDTASSSKQETSSSQVKNEQSASSRRVSSNSSDSVALKESEITSELTAVAVAYYCEQGQVPQLANYFHNYTQGGFSVVKSTDNGQFKHGDGTVYLFSAKGAATGLPCFTMNNGTIYLYYSQPGGSPSQHDGGETQSQEPISTISLAKLVSYINQHHDAKTVRPIAMSVTIDDRNSQSQKEDSQKVVVHNADEAVTLAREKYGDDNGEVRWGVMGDEPLDDGAWFVKGTDSKTMSGSRYSLRVYPDGRITGM